MSEENVELHYRSIDAVNRRDLEAFLALMDVGVEAVVGMRDLGDVTIATFSAAGHGAGSELPFEDNAWLACRWRHGKCIWWQVFRDEAEALEAAGE
jgi:hypothetical protein